MTLGIMVVSSSEVGETGLARGGIEYKRKISSQPFSILIHYHLKSLIDVMSSQFQNTIEGGDDVQVNQV